LQDRTWVFLHNYSYISQDQQFWASFWLGTTYAVVSIVLQLLAGVGAALILNEAFWGRSLLRGIVLFPYMIPTIVAVIVWKWIFNDQYGIVNYWLMALGLVQQPVVWLGPERILPR
jgi:multiple sugar transport system permease protein